MASSKSRYEQIKVLAAERAQKVSQEARDIGPIPSVVNPGRRESCRLDLKRYLLTYHAEQFYLPMGDFHDRAIERFQRIVISGGLSALAMPRGSGKTTIVVGMAEWALLYGHRRYLFLIGANDSKATKLIDILKMSLESNPKLLEDFPEVCFPIHALERISHRCRGQTCDGEPTMIGWTSDKLVFPTIKASAVSGSRVVCSGITGAIRGELTMIATGEMLRPDLALVDDPQTDESARSKEQCKERISLITGAVLGLAGPGRKIAAIVPCTIIRDGDAAHQILDRQKHPEMQGETTQMVVSFPKSTVLWDQYAEIRRDSLRRERGGVEGTDFYVANREAMDEGFVVSWPERHDPDEISGQQHAQNLRIDRGDAVFFSEYQNAPLLESNDTFVLTADQIKSKINRRPRSTIPLSCQKLVAFIDVQQECLFYGVCAFEPDFTGYVVDYGVWPDQKRRIFTRRELPHTLTELFPQHGREARIFAALGQLTDAMLTKHWLRDDSAVMRVDRCLIDANWGALTKTVYDFCRTCKHGSVVMPSHGKFISVAGTPMCHWKKKQGEAHGDNWLVAGATRSRFLRHIVFDANHWKSYLMARLATQLGDAGCLSLFGTKPDDHSLLADHLTAEYPIRVTGRGRVVEEWKQKSDKPDNDWLDVFVGCMVAASHSGLRLRVGLKEPDKIPNSQTPRPARRKVSYL